MKAFTVILTLLVAGCAAPKPKPSSPKPVTRSAFAQKLMAARDSAEVSREATIAAAPWSEIPVSAALPSPTQRVRREGQLNCVGHDENLLLWHDDGRIVDIPLPLCHHQNEESDVTLVGDRVVVATLDWRTNWVQEYQLLNYNNGLPNTAALVMQFPYGGSNGLWNRAIKTRRGGVVVATIRHDGSYNNDLAYRFTSGAWKTYYRDYHSPNGLPSYDLQLEEGNDAIYTFIPRDSSHTIACARWSENADGLHYLDFRGAFLGPDEQIPELAPDGERPQARVCVDVHHTNRFLISCQGDLDSQYDCLFRKSHLFIGSFETFTNVPAPTIGNWKLDYQLLDVSFSLGIPGVEYTVQASTNLVNQFDANVYDALMTKAGWMLYCENPLWTLYSDQWPLSRSFISVGWRSYRKSLLVWTPEYVERAWHVAPMWPTTSSLYFVLTPLDERCIDTNSYLRRLDYASGAVTDLGLLNYTVKSWGNGQAIIQRGTNYFVRRMP